MRKTVISNFSQRQSTGEEDMACCAFPFCFRNLREEHFLIFSDRRSPCTVTGRRRSMNHQLEKVKTLPYAQCRMDVEVRRGGGSRILLLLPQNRKKWLWRVFPAVASPLAIANRMFPGRKKPAFHSADSFDRCPKEMAGAGREMGICSAGEGIPDVWEVILQGQADVNGVHVCHIV